MLDVRETELTPVTGSQRVKIRPCTAEEYSELGDLIRQQYAHHQQMAPWLQTDPQADWPGFARSKLRSVDLRVLTAYDSERMVGYIEIGIVDEAARRQRSRVRTLLRRALRRGPAYSQSVQQPRKYGVIHEIFVIPGSRNSPLGIGFRLYHAGLDWFKEQGVAEVEGWTLASNQITRNLCRKLGFEEVSVLLRKRI